MRADPAEIRLASTAVPRRRLSAPPAGENRPTPHTPGAIDEAFAVLGDSLARIDAPESQPARRPRDDRERKRQNQALVAGVVSQLESLDRQRRKLAQLLAGIDISQRS